MLVSTLITSLVGGYILENISLAFYTSLTPLHLFVARAGLAGCLIGVTLWHSLNEFFTSAIPNYLDFIAKKVNGKIEMIASLATVCGVTFGCLEVALFLRSGDSERLGDSEACSAYAEYQYASSNLPELLHKCIPRSLQWLSHFLSTKTGKPSLGYTRVVVLGYWAFVLALCLPVAFSLKSWVTRNMTNVANTNMSSNTTTDGYIHNDFEKQRKKRVVIARKYFHLIAILLFVPITWVDPDMMSLSHAISTALLIVVEMVRRNYAVSLNELFMVFLDEKDASAQKGGFAVTHIALIVGCAFPLWVYQLLQQSPHAADEQSSCFHSEEILSMVLPFLGVLVLGIGDSVGAICGIKLGHHRWPGGSSRTLEGSLCMLLSMMVVIFCSSSFIASTNTAKYQNSSDIMKYAFSNTCQVSVLLGILTLIEASTAQIDNLCLPIAGSTYVLLMAALPLHSKVK